MKEVITTTGIAAGTGLFTWIFTKLQTRRERKKSDLQMINEVVSPLLASISQLTVQNNEMVNKLLIEQDKNLKLIAEKAELMTERYELIERISGLEKEIKNLKTTINKYINKNEA